MTQSVKGTLTEQNLKAAFAGESQANRRYLYFANMADVAGDNDISALLIHTKNNVYQAALGGRCSAQILLPVGSRR